MKTNELRIGSYYNYDGGSIKLDGSTLASYLQNDTDLYLEPIPLTEEWLLKFGFEKRKDIFYKFGNYTHTISLNKNGDSYRLEVVCQSVAWIKTVHQLQNLYFALTGKELNHD